MPNYDKNFTGFISKNPGSIIKSPRTFGVELEMVNPLLGSIEALNTELDESFGFEHDGSIDGPNPIEVVTPILGGKAGEDALKNTLKKVNDLDFEVNNSCGLHIHLGGENFVNNVNIKYCELQEKDKHGVVEAYSHNRVLVSKKLVLEIHNNTNLSKKTILNTLYQWFKGRGIHIGKQSLRYFPFNADLKYNIYCSNYVNKAGLKYFYLAYPNKTELRESRKKAREISSGVEKIRSEISTYDEFYEVLVDKYGTTNEVDLFSLKFMPEIDDYLMAYKKDINFENTKTLLYLHSAFQDFFYAMIPEERRNGYRHCKSIAMDIAPRDIEYVENANELEELWYKSSSITEIENRKTGTKYDGSRYHGLNLHSLFAQNKTVEIRYHAGTLDINSILHWIAFHQHILDSIVSGNISIERLTEGAYLYGLSSKMDFLLKVLNLPKPLENYVIARINHFSN